MGRPTTMWVAPAAMACGWSDDADLIPDARSGRANARGDDREICRRAWRGLRVASRAEVTMPWHPLVESEIGETHDALFDGVRQADFFEIAATHAGQNCDREDRSSQAELFAASTAASSILPLPEACTVSMLTPSFAASATADPTVLGMS